jgi:hypothetical protein
MFDASKLSRPLSEDRDLCGIDLNDAGQMRFLTQLDVAEDLITMRLEEPPTSLQDFYIGNPSFGPGDAEFLYQFLCATKPRKVIEIGSGYSTKIARLALERNRKSNATSAHVCIEPYEMGWLQELGEIEVVRKKLEDCEIDWARALEPGDLLFIDSSHIIRPQGDVLKEYLEILPRLAPGVYVHIHDIFTPKDYRESWIAEDILFWNEQYLVEALLTNSHRYEIIAGVNYLKSHHYDELKRVCPYLTSESQPSSLYLRVRPD